MGAETETTKPRPTPNIRFVCKAVSRLILGHGQWTCVRLRMCIKKRRKIAEMAASRWD